MFSHLSLAKQVVPAQAHTTGLANDGINGNNINLIEFTAIIANTSKCVWQRSLFLHITEKHAVHLKLLEKLLENFRNNYKKT